MAVPDHLTSTEAPPGVEGYLIRAKTGDRNRLRTSQTPSSRR